MAIDFTNAVGNLFNRLGKIFGFWCAIEEHQTTTVEVQVDGIDAQYDAAPELIPTLEATRKNAKTGAGSVKGDLILLAQNTVIEMVDDDVELPVKSLDFALPELIDQMQTNGYYVDANSVGVSVAADADNNGDGQCLVSVIRGDGKTLENVYAETLVIECTTDSQPGTGGLTIGSELFAVRGESSAAKTSETWPLGSNGQTQVRIANPDVDASADNFLTNGDFEAFTSNAPDSWDIINGTAGTTVDDTATAYRGSSALAIVGTAAATRVRLSQTLRAAPTTAGSIKPETRYAIGVWIRVSSVPAAGTLRIALRDGTTDGATVVGGQAITVDLTGEATSYAFHSVQFNTPAALPDNLYLVVELTVAVDNGVSVYVDNLALAPMIQHQNGPLVCIFPGATKFLKGDKFNATVTNNFAGRFQTFFNRAFNMDSRGLLLPSDIYGSESIDDALISC